MVTAPGDRLTGVARYAAALAAEWQRTGHDIAVAVNGPGEASAEFARHRELAGRIHEVALPALRRKPSAVARHAVGLWTGTAALSSLVAHHASQVVVGHCIFNVWSAWASARCGVPFVPVVHELPFSYPGVAYDLWQRVILAHARHVIAVSDAVAATFPAHAPPHSVVPVGVDGRSFHVRVSGARLRSAWLESSAGPLLVCVSHLMPPKGQLDAVRALPAVVRVHPEARLIFVGGANGVPAQEAYACKLRREAAELGLAEHVHFAGPLPQPQEAFAAADVVVYPSHGESFGLVPLEVCAMGRWLVATGVGVVPKLQALGAPVLGVRIEDPEQLGTALVEACSRPRPPAFLHTPWTVEGAAEAFNRVLAAL